MKKRKIIGLLLWIIGFIMYLTFLTLVSVKFGSTAHLFAWISSIGAVLFVNGIGIFIR